MTGDLAGAGERIDPDALARGLARCGLDAGALRASHPALLSDAVVRVDARDQRTMAELVAAIEEVVALPVYREAVLAWAPAIARHDPGYPGVFLGYDFHLTPDGPRLIEINSNAGGGFLNACLRAAHAENGASALDAALAAWVDVFREEARLAGLPGMDAPRLAIVDARPAEQFLFPEFGIARRIFAEAGWRAVIADPSELSWDGERLRHATGPVDIVYNRLTDFTLADPAHAALRAAWMAGQVALTPHPRTHALYADKRNMTLLSNPGWLEQAGVPATLRTRLLAGIPRTTRVRPEDGETLWQARKTLFFKPASGFGSRAAYRGDKLTRKVFGEILAGDYVAQVFAPPSTRRVRIAGRDVVLKLDLRQYVYRGRLQLAAARLYQGQLTNMRTPGGGFAAVTIV
ncbi:MAG: hypothetical protein LBO79_08480 [Zoogloeaceae bacterium]|jgi:hypothetical protein|nr:hypothetical protein [Zoogloeaceae bacterium]